MEPRTPRPDARATPGAEEYYTPEVEAELEAIAAHVDHQGEHDCCHIDKLGRVRSGSGCATERELWARTGMSRARPPS